MGKELERLEVVIEADSKKLKQGTQESWKSVKSMVDSINKDIGNIKSPMKNMSNNESAKQLNSVKAVTNSIKQYVKEAQVASGLRVYSEDYKNLEKDIANAEKTLSKLQTKQQSMSDSDIYEESEEYRELTKCIGSTEKKLNSLLARQEKMRANGESQNSKSWKNLQYDIEETKNTLDAYKTDAENMKEDGSMMQHTKAWNDVTSAIRRTEAEVDGYLSKKAGMEASGTDTKASNPGKMSSGSYLQSAAASLSHIPRKMQEIRSSINQTVKKIPVIGRVATESAYIASKAFGGLRAVFNKISPAIKKAGGVFASLIQKFTNGIPILNRAKKSASGMGNQMKGLGGMFRTIGTTARFMFSSFVVSGTLNGVKEGFKNLSQYSNETNASLSMLMSSLTQLKNALAAAFAPILNVVAPILNSLIQKIISVVNVFGQLMASLTGQGSYIRAKKVQQDYASSVADTSSNMDDTADSTDKATKASEKYQKTLLGFDQINKLNDTNDSDSGSSGAKVPNAGAGGLSPSDMFETVPIDNKVKNLADKIKEAWKNADFTEIGAMIGDKLNKALENIPWDKIKETARKIAKSIATFLNGFIETTDWGLVGNTLAQGVNTAFEFLDSFAQNFHWDSLGKAIGEGINGGLSGIDWDVIDRACTGISGGLATTLNNALYTTDWKLVGQSIGNGINTAINTAYTFVTTFDWKKFGISIADGINGTFETIDFAKAGQTASELIKGLLDTFIQAIENTDWKLVGEKVREFLVNIDWKGIVSRLSEVIGAAFGGLAAFIGGLIGDSVTAAKEYFRGKIEECGGNVVAGILKGIGDAVINIGQWIYDNVFTPFIEGFKKAFGIHSPSTVMAEQGGFVMDGFLEGAKSKIESVIAWFTGLPGRVKEALGDAKNWLVEKGKGAITGLKNGWNAVKESTIGQAASRIGGYVKQKAGDAKNWVKQKGSDAIAGLKNGWEAVKSGTFLSKVGNIAGEVFTKIGNIKGKTTGKGKDVIKGMVSGYNAQISQLMNKIKALKNSIYSGLGNIAGKVTPKGREIVTGMKSGLTNNWSSLTSWLSGIPNRVSSAIGSLYNTGREVMQSFADGMKSIHIPTPSMYISSWDYHDLGNGGSMSTPRFSVQWYASGGFPKNGEMFIANEAGPEMIGRMGNRNVVANNKQITEGIKDAVIDGMMQVFMATNLGHSEQKDVVLEFTFKSDSETIYKIVRKGKKKHDGRYEVVDAF